ncbi:MAG: acyl carrier protein [Oscillospiraceae bacterium]|nr:acyl carrier protein [Ruminococcus sp.]MBQ7002937.1 acyl carrier protein [Oscillospiraceae bacterium]MBQ7012842.1 acyl carrier protein [Oscillospiraceae bacterium]
MVQEKIIEMLAETTDVDASEITADTKFADLGIDSLDITEMTMDLEDEFGITLEMNPELNTVGKLVAAVEALVDEA